MIHMKWQALFPLKNKKKEYLKALSAAIVISTSRFNNDILKYFSYFS